MRSMRGAFQDRDTSVRGIICKGRFVQGAQRPRTFGRGHIGRGHINPAYIIHLLEFELNVLNALFLLILEEHNFSYY
jgi:hypothetical protein